MNQKDLMELPMSDDVISSVEIAKDCNSIRFGIHVPPRSLSTHVSFTVDYLDELLTMVKEAKLRLLIGAD